MVFFENVISPEIKAGIIVFRQSGLLKQSVRSTEYETVDKLVNVQVARGIGKRCAVVCAGDCGNRVYEVSIASGKERRELICGCRLTFLFRSAI